MKLLKLRFLEEISTLALDTAREKGELTFRHGCVLLSSDNRLLSVGFNRSNGGYIQKGMFSVHAESMAIRKAIRKYGKEMVRGSKLYVFRLTKAGNPSEVQVCENCTRHIERAGVGKVYCHQRTTPITRATSKGIEAIRRRDQRSYKQTNYKITAASDASSGFDPRSRVNCKSPVRRREGARSPEG
jgi:tRNA(Arg) A34 adenosine deaminase TadA